MSFLQPNLEAWMDPWKILYGWLKSLTCIFPPQVICHSVFIVQPFGQLQNLSDLYLRPSGSPNPVKYQVSKVFFWIIDPGRNQDFGLFLKWLQSRVRPSAVIISGDLTAGSLQRLDDWIIYKVDQILLPWSLLVKTLFGHFSFIEIGEHLRIKFNRFGRTWKSWYIPRFIF